MRALLLSAGFGTRLHPVTRSTPKCLVPIRGRPLIDYWFDHLFSSGQVERALVNTHYLASQVEEHVTQSQWGKRVDLVYEAELLGTGGTIKFNRSYFGAESFLVAHADRPADCALTMLTFRSDDPRSCGIVELDASGRVIGFHEKVADPPGNLANAAVYIFSPEVADFIAGMNGTEIDLSTEVIPQFVGRILAVESRGYHRDIGTIESLRQANEDATAALL
jgi:mannose-1-phosphate guanylyltransferase